MTATRHSAPYLWLALSGTLHLSLILGFLWWSTSTAYRALQKIEISFVQAGEQAPAQLKLEKKALNPPVATAKPVSDSAPAAASAPVEATAKVAQDPAAGEAQADLQEYEKYAQEVARTLNRNKVYPEISRRLRQQGLVKVRFRIERSGRVTAAEVIEQSSFTHLNTAAQRLIEEIRFFRPFPQDVKETTWLFTVPIEYKM